MPILFWFRSSCTGWRILLRAPADRQPQICPSLQGPHWHGYHKGNHLVYETADRDRSPELFPQNWRRPPIAGRTGRRRCWRSKAGVEPAETPVGIEPTSTGLQPVAWPSGSSVKYPRQESNLIPDLRRVVCDPPHPEDIEHPAEESNLVLQFRRLPCHPSHPQGPNSG